MDQKTLGRELLDECKALYGAKSDRELANMIGIPPTTLAGMSDRLTAVSKLLLETLIENKKLKRSQKVVDAFAALIEERNNINKKGEDEKNQSVE